RILVSLRVSATPAHAFRVFTREIALWWRPNDLFQFTAGPPGRLAFEEGRGGRLTETSASGEVFEIGRVTARGPGGRLGFTGRQACLAPSDETSVGVRFEPVGRETRVTVEPQGWDSVPPEHVARHGFPDAIFLRRHGEWWQSLLGSLRRQFENLNDRGE